MTDLSGLLNRLFIEVNPLYSLPKKAKARKPLVGDLFAPQVELSILQIVPSLFAERAHNQNNDRPCLVVLDTEIPMILPATTADFMEADFKYRAYQVPLFTGKSNKVNLEERVAQKAAQSASMKKAKELDSATQTLLRSLADSNLSPKVIHALVEKLRVWSVEDYLQPSYLSLVDEGLAMLTKELTTPPLTVDDVALYKGMVLDVKHAQKEIETSVSKDQNPLETFTQLFLQMSPTIAQNPALERQLRIFIANPTLTLAQRTPALSEDTLWLDKLSNKSQTSEKYQINTAIATFIESQIITTAS